MNTKVVKIKGFCGCGGGHGYSGVGMEGIGFKFTSI